MDLNYLQVNIHSLLFRINESTIIFNKVPDQWGAYKYEESKDQLRVKVKPQPLDNIVEKLTYTVNQNSVDVVWEKWKLSFDKVTL